MDIEKVREFIESTKVGDRVTYHTDLELDNRMRHVKVIGRIKGIYYLPEVEITVTPESISILTEGEERPHREELPGIIASSYTEIDNYRVLRE